MSKSIAVEESTSTSTIQPATAGTRSKLTGIFTTRKRQLRLQIIVLGAVAIVFVIIPRIVAYNCSALFNLKKKLDNANIAKFQPELGAMGYKFQFVSVADFYALNSRMFNLARAAKQLP